MITKEIIQTLYKKYHRRAKSIDSLDMATLFDAAGAIHDINVDIEAGKLIIGSIEEKSIFRSIPLGHIHAIVPFEEWVAIVLHSSIIFLNRKDQKVSVHIKPPTVSVADRIKGLFGSHG